MMSEKIKNYLGIAVIVTIISLAFTAFNYTRSYSESVRFTSFRGFSVSAEGKATVIPDIAEFTFSVITEGGKNLSELQGANTEKSNAVIDFIKLKGVSASDIKTNNYSISPRYKYYNCGFSEDGARACPPPEIVGYSINQAVGVKIRDFGKIGDILGGIVQSGANSVSELTFILDDPKKAEDEARGEAIKKAKEKAKIFSQAGGFRLGNLISIYEDTGGYPRPQGGDFAGYGLKEAIISAPSPTIEPGSGEVRVVMTLSYEIR
ncbi:MAG TPA: SIMPL domain-containing protein [Candidatus Paceibacterota bacterium]